MYTNHSNYFSLLSCEHPYLGDYIKKLRQILIYLRKKKKIIPSWSHPDQGCWN